MGREARGVRGMQLEDGQQVIALLVAGDEQESVLTATENGYGKRTPITEYTRHGRGTKGMIAIQTSERNGKVVAATLVDAEAQIMLITNTGVLIRTRVSEIREMGRATQVLHSSALTKEPSFQVCNRLPRRKRMWMSKVTPKVPLKATTAVKTVVQSDSRRRLSVSVIG